MPTDDVPVTNEAGKRVGTARVFANDDGDLEADLTVDDDTARMLTAGLIKDVSLDTDTRVISTPAAPGELFYKSVTGSDRWKSLGIVVDASAFLSGVQSAADALTVFGKSVAHSITVAVPPSTIAKLRRILIAPDDCKCYTCLRGFRGPWQRVKHERTAHG